MITGQMDDSQWNHLMTIGRMHNQASFDGEKQSVLNEYVIKHESELDHMMIVETLLENVELTPDFIEEQKDYVNAVYRIAKKVENQDQQSLRSIIRIERFFQLMGEEKMNIIS
jgi:hypothetical protein